MRDTQLCLSVQKVCYFETFCFTVCLCFTHRDTSVVVTTPFSQFPSRSSFSIRPGNPNLEFPANLSLSKRNRRMEGYETLNSKIAEEDRERERENRNALVGRVVDDYGARPA